MNYESAIREYERFKQEFLRDHPNASSQEYEEAMKKKAKELGV